MTKNISFELRKRLNNAVKKEVASGKEFRKESDSSRFINKEHLYYYKIYMDVIGEIPEPKKDQKECPFCEAGMDSEHFHCRVCGNILDWRLN